MQTPIATVVLLAGMAGVAHGSCPLGVAQSTNANDNGCQAQVVGINPGVLSSRLYQGNARMEVEWPQDTFGGDPNTDVRVTLALQDTATALASPCGYGFVEAVVGPASTPVLDEVVKNTGNFSWIVANFNHEASATYFIHILPVLDVATFCTEAGNSASFATTASFTLEPQLVTWAWPPPEGVAIEPGKTNTIHIENVINHARRWYFALDLHASIDNFNTETADTHSWKCRMRHGNDEAVTQYAANQHPPWDLVAHPREILDIPNLLGFTDEFEGWHSLPPGDSRINTSITYDWTLPADTTAYFKQGGAYYERVRDDGSTIMLTDPDVTLQIQIRVAIHDNKDHAAGTCDCRISGPGSDVTDPNHCGTVCTPDGDTNGNGVRDYNDNNNNGVADAGDTWIENRWWFFDTNGNEMQDAGEATAYFSPPVKFISSLSPTMSPTTTPTAHPTANPTLPPTRNPTADPTKNPTANPTLPPTRNPTGNPTKNPTANPTSNPTANPTANPTKNPTANPTAGPSTSGPTPAPSAAPATSLPTPPTGFPTSAPTSASPSQSPLSVPPSQSPSDEVIMADGSQSEDDAEAGFDWWIILVILLLLLLCCCIGMLWKRRQTGAGKKEPTYGEAGGGIRGWERENPAYAGVGEMSLLAGGKGRDGAVGNPTYEETSFDKPGQPALENNTYVALGSQSRPRDGAVANAVYDVVDPLANGGDGFYGEAVAPPEEATYGDVLPYTGEGRGSAVANVTYETAVGSPPIEEDNYTAVNMPDGEAEQGSYLVLGRSNTDESTYSAAAPRDDDDDYLTTGPPAANDPTYLDASGVGLDAADRGRRAGSVRNNLYGAAGVRQDPMYDEVKASLPETEYASTEQIRPQRTLTEENDPANIYMARRESEDPKPAPPFLAERKATVWDISELSTATRESSEEATSLLGGAPSASRTSSLAIRRNSSQGAAVPNTLHLQIPGGSPEYAGAPAFTPTSPAGSRDFQEPMSPAGKSPTTQSATI